MRSRTVDIIRGVTSLVLLAGVLLAIPWALVTQVGWPLPHAVPTWEQISRALTRGDLQDWTIIKALAVVVWLAWGQLTLSVAAETAAYVRRRPTPRLASIGPLGRVAANAVASIAVLISTLGRPSPSVAETPPALEQVLVEQPAPSPRARAAPDADLSRSAPVPEAQGATDELVITVKPRDTLWDLADRYLGDGLRWREIHRLNAGRLQPDGGALADDGHIRLGWTLRLPADAASAAAPSGPTESDGERVQYATVEVERGDTLWDLAGRHLDDPFRWPEIYEDNVGITQPDGLRLEDPDLIQPGWVLRLPTVSAPGGDPPAGGSAEDVSPREPTAPSPPAVPSPGGPELLDAEATSPSTRDVIEDAQASSVAEASADAEDPASRYFAIAGVAMSAAAVAATLERIRRAKRRRRRPGERIRLPDGQGRRTEVRVRALADDEATRLVDQGLRSLGAACQDAGRPVPPIVLVSISSHDVAIHLASSDQGPPEGWDVQDGGRTWARRVDSGPPEDGMPVVPHPTPLLVSLGTTASGLRRVLLNLGHVRRLSLDVEADQRVRLLSNMAIELATTGRADALDVLTYGFGGRLAAFERLRFCEGADDVVDRLRECEEGAEPESDVRCVALAMDELKTPLEPSSGPGCAIVSPNDEEAAWRVVERDGTLRLLPAGVELQPLEIDPQDVERLAELVLDAKSAPRSTTSNGSDPSLNGHGGDVDQVIDLERQPDPLAEQAIEVRILGSVEVTGIEELTSAKAEELIVYLALHRGGATVDELQEALWPEEPPSSGRLHTTAWRARQALGEDEHGEPRLSKLVKGRYTLSSSVGLDYERFRAHVARARSAPEIATRPLRDALELVRGEPLTGTASEYSWAHLDTHAIAQEIADAAHELATQYLKADRPGDARWAAEQGLRADPYMEALYRDLMEAAAASGSLAEVEVIMNRLRQVVAEDATDNDADDRLDAQTIALFHRLHDENLTTRQGWK